MAVIQFIRGIDEEVIPDVQLTRSKDGQTGRATFFFQDPKSLPQSVSQEIQGMYMIDSEGELVTREVNAKFVNGQPAGLEAFYTMKTLAEWERFMRFMERYAEKNNLGFVKS